MITRIQDSVQSAFNEGNGHMTVVCEGRANASTGVNGEDNAAVGKRIERNFSNIFVCTAI